MPQMSMRRLLEDARDDLCALWEQGLSHTGRENALEALAERLEGCGLVEGARLARALDTALKQLRREVQSSSEPASSCYAQLWRYLSLCLHRLEFYEAEAQLREE